MSMLSEGEIRYTAISLITLTIITRVLNQMAVVSDSRVFNPAERSIPTIGSYKITQGAYWANLTYTDIPSVMGDLAEMLVIGFGPIANLLNGWLYLVDAAGWASAFVIVPSTIMFFVLLNGTYQIVKALPST